MYLFLMLITLVMCKTEKAQESKIIEKPNPIEVENFGTMPDGKKVNVYTLTNKNGLEMKVINYGGIIVSLKVPDKNGELSDVVLGYDSLTPYLKSNPYFGALIGRYGNRIAKGKFNLDGKEFTLPVNNGENHLHGGEGFDKVFWNIEIPEDSSSLQLSYTSADGEQGYPGTLSVVVNYVLSDSNELKIDYRATTDKKTIVNLTQHTYFNLRGNKATTILDHTLQMEADHFLPVDKTLIPTGELKKVSGTPFDFLKPQRIGDRIDQRDEQLIFGLGYDHCWALNKYDGKSLRKVATLAELTSGRIMEVFTTEPGLQFYSGNFLDGTLKGKNGVVYQYRSGLCLETQHYPDSPNQSAFPSVVLNPGEVYQTTTVYKFLN